MIKPLLIVATCGILCKEIKPSQCVVDISTKKNYRTLAVGTFFVTAIDLKKENPEIEVLWKDDLEPTGTSKCLK